MAKRAWDEDDEEQSDTARHAPKRQRGIVKDRLSLLSDELLLKVLSFLSVPHLAACQRISRKYRKLAEDGQLWKSHYYHRFVRPRASRLPVPKELGQTEEKASCASKASRWLDDEHLVRHSGRTNWKRQYKLRHNWAKGTCAVNEIPVAPRTSVPPVILQMSGGMVYMVDKDAGLRVWIASGSSSEPLAQLSLPANRTDIPPTSLAVESSTASARLNRLAIGFEDGSFAICTLDRDKRALSWVHTHTSSSAGVITTIAMSWPYVVTMTATQLLSLYRCDGSENEQSSAAASQAIKRDSDPLKPPVLLHSLRSQSAWPPLSVQLRRQSAAVTICIAYALPTYLSGWTVGLQEVNIGTRGDLLGSRLASAIDQHYRPLAFSQRPMLTHLGISSAIPQTTFNSSEMRHIHSKPTTLSYNHPYLLVSHPDNTLTLYLVTSTTDSLSISPGSRLWGHTSAVSGAHVASRGKAVSVSRRGEVRLWELEGGFTSPSARKRLADGDLSIKVKVAPDVFHRDEQGDGATCRSSDLNELALSRGWIGFDDENVVVLKEHSQGQALVVYDFT